MWCYHGRDPLLNIDQRYPSFHNLSEKKDSLEFKKSLKSITEEDPPTLVLETVYDNVLSETKITVPCYESVKSTMQRYKAQKYQLTPYLSGPWLKKNLVKLPTV